MAINKGGIQAVSTKECYKKLFFYCENTGIAQKKESRLATRSAVFFLWVRYLVSKLIWLAFKHLLSFKVSALKEAKTLSVKDCKVDFSKLQIYQVRAILFLQE